MSRKPSSRLGYIDWLRGLACVLMFQTHCYDAWLTPQARNSSFFMYSQLLGTFPAPLFLFLAGISFAFVTDRLREKGLTTNAVTRQTIRRGAEILAFGFLFRLQEFAIAMGWAPWSDLFRVDILNTIGVSMMLMGVLCWFVGTICQKNDDASAPEIAGQAAGATAASRSLRPHMIWAAFASAAAISALTPLLWTSWRPDFLPWEIESYINGVHNLGQPQAWIFPIFPWGGFAFAGLALGFILRTELARNLGWRLFVILAAAGLGFFYLATFLDSRQYQLYPVFDFWHTSPEFFMMRVGMLLGFLLGAYAWCRWGAGQIGFSPLIQFGNTSLLVYWVHLELVYGKFSILARRSQSIGAASLGLLTICLLMLVLSVARTAWKTRASGLSSWTRLMKRDSARKDAPQGSI